MNDELHGLVDQIRRQAARCQVKKGELLSEFGSCSADLMFKHVPQAGLQPLNAHFTQHCLPHPTMKLSHISGIVALALSSFASAASQWSFEDGQLTVAQKGSEAVKQK